MEPVIRSDLEQVLVVERETWKDGPPHELFKRLRHECPVHWSESIPEYPDEAGYWSLTTADHIHASAATGRPTPPSGTASQCSPGSSRWS